MEEGCSNHGSGDFVSEQKVPASFSAAISALNVANDSVLEEDSKAERLVPIPLSLDPEETCQIKALVIPASRENKKI